MVWSHNFFKGTRSSDVENLLASAPCFSLAGIIENLMSTQSKNDQYMAIISKQIT
jgi:hypothetical protein